MGCPTQEISLLWIIQSDMHQQLLRILIVLILDQRIIPCQCIFSYPNRRLLIGAIGLLQCQESTPINPWRYALRMSILANGACPKLGDLLYHPVHAGTGKATVLLFGAFIYVKTQDIQIYVPNILYLNK